MYFKQFCWVMLGLMCTIIAALGASWIVHNAPNERATAHASATESTTATDKLAQSVCINGKLFVINVNGGIVQSMRQLDDGYVPEICPK